MNSIQIEVIPHQTQEGMPYQRLHFQIMTDDGIITPEDHPNADKLIGEYFKYHAQATANIRQVVNLAQLMWVEFQIQ